MFQWFLRGGPRPPAARSKPEMGPVRPFLEALEDRMVLSAPSVTPGPNQIGIEGHATGFNLGSFSEDDNAPWTVSVNWGDGTTTSFQTLRQGLLGSLLHTYAEESTHAQNGSTYTVMVTVMDRNGGSNSGSFQVTVSDPAVLAVPVPVLAHSGTSFNSPVAVFSDPGGPEMLSDYSATIDWRDGTTTAGTISARSNVFVVNGLHTYTNPPRTLFTVDLPIVTITHENAPATTVRTIVVVSGIGGGLGSAAVPPPAPVTGTPLSVAPGASLPASATPLLISQTNPSLTVPQETTSQSHAGKHLAKLGAMDSLGLWTDAQP